QFPGQVLAAGDRLLGEVGFALGPRFVVRRLEALPQRFALRARHVGGLAPLLLQFADLAGNLLGVVERLERFHLLAELLLNADVRPALPVGDVAQLLHLRRQRGLRRLEALDDLLVVLLRRQLRNRAERSAQLFHGALAGLQRQIGARGGGFDAGRELLQPHQRLAARAVVRFARGAVARRDRLLGLVVLRGDCRIDLAGRAERVPFFANRGELPARGGQVLDGGAGAGSGGQLGEPRLAALLFLLRGVLGGFGARALHSLLLGAQPRRFGVFSGAAFRLLGFAHAPGLGLGVGARLLSGAGDARRFLGRGRCGFGGSGGLGRLLRLAIGGDSLVHFADDCPRPLRGAL